MNATPRSEQLRAEIADRARLVEQNPVHPGEPTLTGLVATLINEVSELKERIEVLERDRPAGD